MRRTLCIEIIYRTPTNGETSVTKKRRNYRTNPKLRNKRTVKKTGGNGSPELSASIVKRPKQRAMSETARSPLAVRERSNSQGCVTRSYSAYGALP